MIAVTVTASYNKFPYGEFDEDEFIAITYSDLFQAILLPLFNSVSEFLWYLEWLVVVPYGPYDMALLSCCSHQCLLS
ncbi:MAG: hypothetical protein QXP36_02495 [Conexivisphaerales archaeon]